MEIIQLRYFVAVAETMSFSEAAERLHVSQPALSYQIKHLETELGCRLFDRTSRKVALSLDGRIFLPLARAVLSKADEALRVGLVQRVVPQAEIRTAARAWAEDLARRPLLALARAKAALQAADLVQVMKGPGPFTVFAPTDEAFAKIPKADLDALLKDKAKLAKVLSYHVFAGNANSTDLAMLKDLSMVNGGRLKITAAKGAPLKVDNATVIKADVPAANGIIHVVDTVLIPK